MKKLLLCLVVTCTATFAFSQSQPDKTQAQTATDQLTAAYSLNAQQAAAMLKIQERKIRNLNEITPVKNTNPAVYNEKVRLMYQDHSNSIRRMLNKDQQKKFDQQAVAHRSNRANLEKELKSGKASKAEIDAQLAQLDVADML